MRILLVALCCVGPALVCADSATPGKPDFTGFYTGSMSGPPPLVAPTGMESGAPGTSANGAAPFFPEDMYTRYNCIPDTAFGYNPYGEQLIMTPGRLTWVNEYNHIVRRIDIDAAAPKVLVPSYTGTSVGRWEGDTLVVTTTGLRKIQVRGIPPTGSVRQVTERIRLLDSGKTLEREVHFQGVDANGNPVEATTRAQYARRDELQLYEFICEDGAGIFGEVENGG